MNKLKLLFVLLPAFLFSCGTDEPEVLPTPTSSFTAGVSGEITSSFDGVGEFVHSIIKSQPGSNGSSIAIILENKDNSRENISLSLFELGNTTGIKEGTYNYVALSSDLIILGTYSNDNPDAYYLLPVDGMTNQITITSVTDTNIKGSYELTIEEIPFGSVPGQVTIKGTFDVLGVTSTF